MERRQVKASFCIILAHLPRLLAFWNETVEDKFSAVWERGFISTICLKVASGGGISFRMQIEISSGVLTLRLDRVRFPWCVSLFTGPLFSLQRSSSARMKIISAGDLLTLVQGEGGGVGLGKRKKNSSSFFFFLALLPRSRARASLLRSSRKKKRKTSVYRIMLRPLFSCYFCGTVWQSV